MIAPFNRAAIETHVTRLHELAAGLDGVIPLFCAEEGKTPKVQRFGVGNVAEMVDTIMGFENHPGLNIYAPLAVMRRDLEPGKKGGEADVIAVLGAVGDIDNDKYEIGELPFEAPYIIESSAGNFQALYPFTRPLPVIEAKPILEALSDAIGGDDGTKDASHVWRIPGTTNWPTKTKLARGRSPVPQLVTIKKPLDGTLVQPEELASKLPKKTNGHTVRDRQEPPEALASWEEEQLQGALGHIPANDYHTWIDVGMGLHWAGRRDLWDSWSATSAKFNANEQGKKWASFNAERSGDIVTTGTIYKLAGKHGWVAPPLFDYELFSENLKRDANRPNGHDVPESEDDESEPDAGGDGGDIGELPDELTRPGGLLGDVIDYINDTARQPNRVLAMGAAITVLGTLVGRRMAGPTLSGTHLYDLTLAPSGAGKDHALRKVPLLLKAASARHLLGSDDFMSQSAVINLLSRKPLCLCAMDEFGAFLKRISNKRASGHEKAVTKVLRSAWGVSFGTMTTPEWAGKPCEEMWAPALSVCGVSTAGDFFSSLQAEDVVNGFLNRFLLLKTDTLSADSEPKLDPFTVPADLGLRLKRIYTELNPTLAGQTALYETEGPPHKILPWGAGAEAVFKLMKDDIAAIRKDTALEPLFARTAEMAVRLATIASIEDEHVSRGAMTWGRDLAMWSARSMAKAAGEYMAENDRASKANQVLKFLKRRSKPASRSEIRRHIGQGLDGRAMDDIMKTLAEAEFVKEQPQVASVKGGPKPKYPKYSAAG